MLIAAIGHRHIDWYRDTHDQARGWPIMCAARRGVTTAPDAAPGDITDHERATAQAVHVALALNPDTNLAAALHAAHRTAPGSST